MGLGLNGSHLYSGMSWSPSAPKTEKKSIQPKLSQQIENPNKFIDISIPH